MEGRRTSDDDEEAAGVADAGTTNTNHHPMLAGQVDVLDASERRSSPFASPTGALRTVPESPNNNNEDATTTTVIQVVPQAHAEGAIPSPRRRGTPTAAAASRRQQRYRVTYEDLVNRPRSNPRSRTPMRYESPLEHAAFRREEDNDTTATNEAARTISIRPSAGLGVGVVRAMPERIHFDDTNRRPQPITLNTKSQKQGPSHRKSRRWNNDNFTNTHHDLANSSSARGRAAAEILAAAKADARHFLPVCDFAQKKPSDKITRFMEDAKYRDVRDQFFRGELHATCSTTNSSTSHQQRRSVSDLSNPSAEDLYQRVDARLRRVVVKACENSAPACKIVESFEHYLIRVFDGKDDASVDDDFWRDVLLEKPAVREVKDLTAAPSSTMKSGQAKTVTFLFDGDSSSGGFHRLLVHAVSHFHCLKAMTSTRVANDATGTKAARVLTVQGVLRGGKYRLLDHLASLQEQKQKQKQQLSLKALTTPCGSQ